MNEKTDIRVTPKMLSAFNKVFRKPFGLSVNESYNVQVYKITTPQYKMLSAVYSETYGSMGGGKALTKKQVLDSWAYQSQIKEDLPYMESSTK